MTSCKHCGSQLPENYTEDKCPVCGRPLQDVPSPLITTATTPIKNYFRDMWLISTHPSRFFKQIPLKGGVSWPLAFALITHWLGSALEFMWRSAVGGKLARHVTEALQIFGDVADIDHPGRSSAMNQVKDQLIHWFWGAGSVVADPFITLASILFTSLLVFIGARILITPGKKGSPSEITFESALRIMCFGMAPSVFAGIPVAGGVISSIWVVLVTIVAAKVVYAIGYARATVVVLFPKLLFLATLLFGLLFFLIAAVKLIATVF